MRFELKDLHRNLSNEDLICDVVSTAKKLGIASLTVDQ